MDRARNPPKTLDEIFREVRAAYEAAGSRSIVTLLLFRDEQGRPSGYQMEKSRKEMVEISLD